jgi:tRNA A-37 threonylcarbamoyl transferase component Bud32
LALLRAHENSKEEFETPAAAMEAHRHLILPDFNGRLLKDRYRVDRQFSSGGFAAVYLAIDEQIVRRKVVIKLFLQSSLDADWVDRTFDREMRALASLQHPGVVGILDQGVIGSGHRYLVMPYVEGKTLAAELEQGPISKDRAIALIRQFGSALAAAHALGIAHHDLKPQNLIVQQQPGCEEQLVIVDFGIAQLRDPGVATRTLTRVFGSPQYMPPEQIRGKPTFATDIYAMALVCWQMVAGCTPEEILHRAGTTPRNDVERVLMRGLDSNPAARPQNARKFSEEIASALSPEQTHRRPLLLGLMLAVIAVAVTVAAIFLHTHEAEVPAGPVVSCAGITQRFLGDRPAGDPVRFEGNPQLREGDGLRLECTVNRPGFVYLVGESNEPGAETEWALLFPEQKRGMAAPAERIQVPASQKDWIRLRDASSREQINVIWTDRFEPVCEQLLVYANPTDQGQIRNRVDAASLAQFLNQPPAGAVRIRIPIEIAQK